MTKDQALKLKVGRKVRWVGPFEMVGKVVGFNPTKSGLFVNVDFGDKKNPDVKALRPAALTTA